jgi:hypothetical protein
MKPNRSALLFVWVLLALLFVGPCAGEVFYVDPQRGRADAPGTRAEPFASLDRALAVVDARVRAGHRSDRIYLRAGVYRKDSALTLYRLNLRGTPDAPAVLSAMPAEPGAPGAVQRKSGRWFERVVFDDAQVITSRWERVPGDATLWRTKPAYTPLEWTQPNLWPWTRHGFPVSRDDGTPGTTTFTVAPHMVLQDGEPLLWEDSVAQLTRPGMKTYDQATGVLHVRPFGSRDPNRCRMESWYGGPEDFESGTLFLDGEGRALFDGNLEHAAIEGFEFRMFTRLFELHRRYYHREEDRVIQRHVRFEDNECRYGWIQILLDANTVNSEHPEEIRPRYADRGNWTVRHNVFFRPSREVFQVHGDDHVFEHNVVLDHGGPWAGPAAIVSAVNTRNSHRAQIRHNYIVGQGNNRWHRGSVFMIESDDGHADGAGDAQCHGQTFEFNLVAGRTSGAALVLGKGGARLKDVTVRHNIFAFGGETAAILTASPQKNLRIENNLFLGQSRVLEVNEAPSSRTVTFASLPSTILVRGNVFVDNAAGFDARLTDAAEGSSLRFADNLHWRSPGMPGETGARSEPVSFRDPEAFDFRLPEGSAVSLPIGLAAGSDAGDPFTGVAWWRWIEVYGREYRHEP